MRAVTISSPLTISYTEGAQQMREELWDLLDAHLDVEQSNRTQLAGPTWLAASANLLVCDRTSDTLYFCGIKWVKDGQVSGRLFSAFFERAANSSSHRSSRP